MIRISYNVGGLVDEIYWGVAEEFSELIGREFRLGDMEAKDIVKLSEFSEVSKILLSAVAGALIQHLMDAGIETSKIFSEGKFIVEVACN
ncbi:hypothetical protein FACS1894191_6580 [Clostridia bacterium]|nr:hypothetical protein FACS1894191_6580 [Clostridia bacterium]